MNTLLVEPFSGMSGDMFLGALCGLADAYEDIVDLPQMLNLPDGKIEINEVSKNGIVCKHVKVIDLNEGKKEGGQPHHDDQGYHHDAHRHLSDIYEIIDSADIGKGAKEIARSIFRLIGEAESSVHDIPIEKIHFHEISAVDSIIDIVGCAVLINRLDIRSTISRPICVGHGTVNTQHGVLPVPAPATAKLLQGMPTYQGEERGERVTPTGAAILKYLRPRFEDTPVISKKEAYGPGGKDFKSANVLRLSLVSEATSDGGQLIVETNLDDCSPELIGEGFQFGLLGAGARDFTIANVLMKKGRPGVALSVLVDAEKLEAVSDYLLEHTPAIGLRYFPVKRRILDREELEVETSFGTVRAKQVTTPSGKKRIKAEYESLAEVAKKRGVSLAEVKRVAESD